MNQSNLFAQQVPCIYLLLQPQQLVVTKIQINKKKIENTLISILTMRSLWLVILIYLMLNG